MASNSKPKTTEGTEAVPVSLRKVLIVDHYFGLPPGKKRYDYLSYLNSMHDVPGYREAHMEILAINKRNRDARSR